MTNDKSQIGMLNFYEKFGSFIALLPLLFKRNVYTTVRRDHIRNINTKVFAEWFISFPSPSMTDYILLHLLYMLTSCLATCVHHMLYI